MTFDIKKGYLAITAILIFSIIVSSTFNNFVLALTDSERYNTGYSWGCSDARKGGHPYLNSHPSHTPIFMNGYKNGYAACSKSTQNWLPTCNAVEWALVHYCGAYVSTSGKLTVEGKRAYDCISGGALLTGAGLLGNLSPMQIIAALQPLSKLYGCDGIVDWTKLGTASSALSFLKILHLG